MRAGNPEASNHDAGRTQEHSGIPKQMDQQGERQRPGLINIYIYIHTDAGVKNQER